MRKAWSQSALASVKAFRITAVVKRSKPTEVDMVYVREIRALTKEQAIEQCYTEIGSKHRAKRCRIRIEKVEEITP